MCRVEHWSAGVRDDTKLLDPAMLPGELDTRAARLVHEITTHLRRYPPALRPVMMRSVGRRLLALADTGTRDNEQ